MAYHVYIERTQDPSAAGRAQVAAAMAARYKLPAAQVTERLAAGRFRVKSGVDEGTARKFAQELVAMGAVCTIVDATTGVALDAPPQPRAPAPPPIQGAPAPQYESGLAAASSPGGAAAPLSLGALDGLAGGGSGISLASLDGSDEGPMVAASLSVAEPPPSALGAPPPLDLDEDEIGAKPNKPKSPTAPSPARSPAPPPTASGKGSGPSADMFNAPDLMDAPLELGPSPAKPKSANTPLPARLPQPPPAAMPQADNMEVETRRAPSAEAQRARMAGSDSGRGALLAEGADPNAPPLLTEREAADAERRPVPPTPRGGPLAHHFAGKERQRILAGLGFALLLGFLPAHLYAGSAEDSRYAEIRQRLDTQQRDLTSEAAWSQLDAVGGARDVAMQDMQRARGRTKLVALVIWLAGGLGLGWLWFRKLT